MRYLLILFCLVLVITSCKKEVKEKEPFKMYQTSELSQMMEKLYVFNDSLKEQIISNKELPELPIDLKMLHTAQMTDRFERDAHFNNVAEVFKKYQTQLYTTSQDSLKIVYNNTINTCVACHQNSCTGPIPRIKKLLIN